MGRIIGGSVLATYGVFLVAVNAGPYPADTILGPVLAVAGVALVGAGLKGAAELDSHRGDQYVSGADIRERPDRARHVSS